MDLRSVGLVSLYGALVVLTPQSSYAQVALPGYSGLISTPNADVLTQGHLAINFSWVNGPQTYLFAPLTNRLYVISVGLLPGLEATIRQTQVIGWHDPEAPGVQHAFDRMVSAKYALSLPERFPKLAVGIQDLASVNLLTNVSGVKPGMTQYGQSAIYGVVGDKHELWQWHIGLGISQAFINGPFAGISFHPSESFSILGEWDSRRLNFGGRFYPFRDLWLQVSTLNQNTLGISCGMSISL